MNKKDYLKICKFELNLRITFMAGKLSIQRFFRQTLRCPPLLQLVYGE